MEQLVNKIYIGIDVSKVKLDIKYDDESSAIVIENKKQAFKSLKQYLPKDTAKAGLSLVHGAIEVQNSNDKKEEPIDQEQENKPKCPPKRYLWAMLLARIYNLFPLLCPGRGTEMQVIAVIQDKSVINKILESVGEATE